MVPDNAQCFSIATPRGSPRRDDAKAAMESEQAKYAELVGVMHEKQAGYEAALDKQSTEGEAGREHWSSRVAAANQRYTDNVARIQAIKETDTDYIMAELEAVGMVENILVELNITDEVSTNATTDVAAERAAAAERQAGVAKTIADNKAANDAREKAMANEGAEKTSEREAKADAREASRKNAAKEAAAKKSAMASVASKDAQEKAQKQAEKEAYAQKSADLASERAAKAQERKSKEYVGSRR